MQRVPSAQKLPRTSQSFSESRYTTSAAAKYKFLIKTYPVQRMNSTSLCLFFIACTADSTRDHGESQLQSPNLPSGGAMFPCLSRCSQHPKNNENLIVPTLYRKFRKILNFYIGTSLMKVHTKLKYDFFFSQSFIQN